MEPLDGYVNHPTGHVPERQAHLAAPARETGHRPRMRIALVALRAYEQRAERRARMRAWLTARAARATRAAPRSRAACAAPPADAAPVRG